MFKRFKSVSTLLLLATISSGATYAATAQSPTSVEVMQQNGKCTGVVKDANDVIIGASVVVKGTSNGASTDIDGNFSIGNVKPGSTLVISYVGYTAQEVTWNGEPLTIVLKENATKLDEVVVTALGIKKDSKKVGYSVSSVNSDDLLTTSSPNLGTALYGKAAGVSIKTAPGGGNGSISINVRGINSITGNNQPLIVIDGVPVRNGEANNGDYWADQRVESNGLADINTEDIENLSILKGASATALYGSEGANGVVLITTKSGKGANGIGVDFSASLTGDFVAYMPQYQTQFGKGLVVENRIPNGDTEEGFYHYNDRNGVSREAARNTTQYWGPAYDGREVLYYDGTMRRYEVQNSNPWNDVFRTGFSQQYNLGITKANDKNNMRFSYTYFDNMPTQENSSFKKHNFSLTGSYKITDNIKLNYTANYILQNIKNRPYRMSRLVTNFGGMFGAFDDVKWLKDHTVTAAGYRNRTWSASDHENPAEGFEYYPSCGALVDEYFWNILGKEQVEKNNRLIASVNPSWEIIKGLTLQTRIATDYTTQKTELKEKTQTSSAFGNLSGYYKLENERYEIYYFDAMLSFDRQLTDQLGLTANVGWQARDESNYSTTANTSGGLTVENWFHLNASKNTPQASMYKSEFLKTALFGTASLSYGNWAYLEGTIRHEKISTLASGSNSFTYPSANASVIYTELLRNSLPSWYNYGKFRVSYGEVGNAPDIYKATQAYNQKTVGGSYIYNQLPTSVGNNLIKPERKYEWELGLESKFFNNRLGFELSYYTNKVKDQILETTMPQSSGAKSILMNIGELQNKGIEFSLYGTPIQTKDWTLSLRGNIAWNKNKVTKLADGVDYIEHRNWDNGSMYLRSYVGESMGDFYSLAPATDDNGNYIIDQSTGFYKLTSDWVKVGNAMPKLTGGFAANASYKGIFLDASFDFRIGGDVFNMPYQYMMGRGAIKESLDYHDGAGKGLTYYLDDDNKIVPATTAPAGKMLHDNGMILEGVDENGNPNQKMIAGDKYCMWTYNWGGYDPSDVTYYSHSVFKNSYLKLRELSIGYNLPKSITEKFRCRSLQLSVYGRNLCYLYKNLPIFDAEATDGTNWQAQAQIGGSTATTRSFGFSLRASF